VVVPVTSQKTETEHQKQAVKVVSRAAGILRTIPSAPLKLAKKGVKAVMAAVVVAS